MTIERGTEQPVTITVKGWDLTGSDIYVTFKTDTKSVTKKTMDIVTYANNASKIILTLSQRETMTFDNNSAGLIQVRWVDANGIPHKTETAPFVTDTLLFEKVLTKDDDGNG